MDNERRMTWEERYRGSGPRPWDTNITPPEVVDFWRERQIPPDARAVDIGCGTGTNAAYLAGLGLTAVGVDISLHALLLAQQRRENLPADVQQRLTFAQADVTRLPFASANAVYMLDVGCFHALSRLLRFDYANGVTRNLTPGGYYHLYAFDRLPDETGEDARGFDETEVADLFAPALSVVEIIRARPDRRPCRWYLLRKE